MLQSMRHESFYTSTESSASELGAYGGVVSLDQSADEEQPFVNKTGHITLLLSGAPFLDTQTGAYPGRPGPGVGPKQRDLIIQRYQEQGDDFVQSLNGFFSGLLIDKQRKRVLLFNDRYGFDRIYFAETKDGFYFASEAKAILQVLPESRSFSREGVGQFLALGCAIDGRTLFEGIKLLPGGSTWSFTAGECQKRSYFSVSQWEAQPPLSEAEFVAQLLNTSEQVLPRYFDSQSRIGISITAGLDSRMLVACRPQVPQEPVCYTFVGDRSETLDSLIGGRVARACGWDHHSLRLESDFFSDFETYVDKTVYLTDGCFGAVGAHEVYFNRAARDLSFIRLTGVFGGEILRAVSTFKPLKLDPSLLDSELAQEVNKHAAQFVSQRVHPVTFAAFREIPWSLFGSAAASRSQVSLRAPYLDNDLVSLAYRTPVAMQNSPEPAVRVIQKHSEALARIPTDMGLLGNSNRISNVCRWIQAKTSFKLDYWANDGLPHWLSSCDPLLQRLNSYVALLGRHKYLHYRRWFRHEFAGYLKDRLNDPRIIRMPFWESGFPAQIVQRHIDGNRNYLQEINALLTLEAVDRLLLRSSTAPAFPDRVSELSYQH